MKSLKISFIIFAFGIFFLSHGTPVFGSDPSHKPHASSRSGGGSTRDGTCGVHAGSLAEVKSLRPPLVFQSRVFQEAKFLTIEGYINSSIREYVGVTTFVEFGRHEVKYFVVGLDGKHYFILDVERGLGKWKTEGGMEIKAAIPGAIIIASGILRFETCCAREGKPVVLKVFLDNATERYFSSGRFDRIGRGFAPAFLGALPDLRDQLAHQGAYLVPTNFSVEVGTSDIPFLVMGLNDSQPRRYGQPKSGD